MKSRKPGRATAHMHLLPDRADRSTKRPSVSPLSSQTPPGSKHHHHHHGPLSSSRHYAPLHAGPRTSVRCRGSGRPRSASSSTRSFQPASIASAPGVAAWSGRSRSTAPPAGTGFRQIGGALSACGLVDGGVAPGWCPVLAVHSSSGPGTRRGRKRRQLMIVVGLIFAACTPTRTPVRETCPARTGHQPRPEERALR